MTRREIATLACKILALWMFAQAAFFVAGVLLMGIISIAAIFTDRGFRWDELAGAAVTGVPALGMLFIGLYFWYRASRLAARMVSDDETPVTRPDITQADLMAVAFSTIGVFTLVPVFRDLAGSFIRIARGPQILRVVGQRQLASRFLVINHWACLRALAHLRVARNRSCCVVGASCGGQARWRTGGQLTQHSNGPAGRNGPC
jgi:hypothetical protein